MTHATRLLEADSIWLECGGGKILQSIYVKLETGKVTGLLGRNGCGKTSLLRMIFGTLRGQSQSVRVDGRYIAHPYLQKNLIRYLPQNNFVPSGLNIETLCRLYNIPFSEILVHFPEFEEFRKVSLGKLSGGNRRLVETLVILLSPVPFVLLDEPFTHLSPVLIEKLSDIITEQKKNKGILLSDHAYRDVLTLSDDLYLIVPIGRSVLINNREEELKLFGYTS